MAPSFFVSIRQSAIEQTGKEPLLLFRDYYFTRWFFKEACFYIVF